MPIWPPGGLPLDELLTAQLPKKIYLIYPVLLPGSKLIIGGPPKAKKSFMLHTLLHALATGTPLWGNPYFAVRQPEPGILFSQELAAEELIERWTAHTNSGALTAAWRSNVHIVWKGQYSLDPANEEGHRNLWNHIQMWHAHRGRMPAWIALDPISKFHLRPENEQHQVMRIIGAMDFITLKTGAAVIYVHHHGVMTQEKKDLREGLGRLRGSSQWFADADAGITVEGRKASLERKITFDLRTAPDEPAIVVKLNPHTLLFQYDRVADPDEKRVEGDT